MSMHGIISAMWDGYNAAEGAGELGGFAVSIAGMTLAETRIEENIRSYIGNRSAANAKAVATNVRSVRSYLRTISVEQPGLKDLVDKSTSAKYMVSISLANFASQLMTNIAMAVDAGNLPALDETPWSSRRAGFARLREGARVMALQFEAMVRRKKKELHEITAFEARLFGLAFAEEMTDADLQMIQQDMNEQVSEENAARRSLAMFTLLANASRKNYDRYGLIIESGDRARGKK